MKSCMSCRVAQWIRPLTLTLEVPGLNPLAMTVCALEQGTLSSLPIVLQREKDIQTENVNLALYCKLD